MVCLYRCPKVCGISSLGYDHTDMLGKTIEEIAWHKAGIFKVNAHDNYNMTYLL